MDKYLKPNSAYNRLWAEYQKYGSLIIAVDYDDTLFDFHGTGESYEMVKQLVRDLHNIGCKIIIWSGTEDIDKMDRFLRQESVPYHAINENIIINGKWASGKDSRKIYANAYLDDRAGLFDVYKDLKKVLHAATTKTFYRVCNHSSEQGLWYSYQGLFTGLIHDRFDFCKNTDLKMDFDSDLVGWLSVVDSLEGLYNWFTKKDIIELQKSGWFIYEYEASDYKFYDRFQHYVINQESSRVIKKIVLENEGV